jgi:tetratricopeptide (TPR) repeat protein
VFRVIAILVAQILVSTSVQAAPADDSVAQAKEYYRRGTALYDLGKYLEAAAEYETAFRLVDRPALLFNIGQAYRLGGKPREALRAYEGFLRRQPEAPQRAEVETQIAALNKQIQEEDLRAQQTAQSAAAEKSAAERASSEKLARDEAAAKLVATPVAAKKPLYKKWWVWTLVGVGAAAIATGVGVGVTQNGRTEGSGTVHFP